MKTKSRRFVKLTESAAPELNSLLCGWFDCDWGICRHVDSTWLLLTPAFCWNDELGRSEKLWRDTDARSRALSERPPGHGWRTDIPVCAEERVRDMGLPRSLDASEARRRREIWFPIRNDQTTVGIVELLGGQCRTDDERSMEELTSPVVELGKLCVNKARGAAAPGSQNN